jgi:hypothetical protein
MCHTSRYSASRTADWWRGHRDPSEVALESRFWLSDGAAHAIHRWQTLLTQFFFSF